jgi:transcriptional regulator with XRE-family HTH domain
MSRARKVEFYGRLGERIRAVRQGLGASQNDLAEALGLSRTSITNIESGVQGVDAYRLTSIADALGIRPEEPLPRFRRGRRR